MNKIDQLIAFAKVADHGSFTKAAEKLKVTPSAISQKVSALENRINLTLINRSSRGMHLTDSGRKIYQSCKKILDNMDEVDCFVDHTKKTPTGNLYITTPIYKSIMPFIKQFLTKYPSVRLNLDCSEQIPDLIHNHIDILFGYPNSIASLCPDDTVQKLIFSSPIVYCASGEYVDNRSFELDKYEPESSTKYQFITSRQFTKSNYLEFANGENYFINPMITVNTNDSLINAAMQNLGIIKIHYHAVADLIKSGKLRQVFSKHECAETKLYLYYSYTRFLKPALRAFIDFMSKHNYIDGLK